MPRLVTLDRIPSRTARPELLPNWQPSLGAMRVLDALVRFRYVTPSLASFFVDQGHARGGWQARHELTRLWRHGYAERFDRKNAEYVYVATSEGARQTLPHKEWTLYRKEFSRRATRGLATFEHSLAVSMVQMLWDLAAKRNPLIQIAAHWADHDQSDAVGQGFPVELSPNTQSVAARRGVKLKRKIETVYPDNIVLLEWRDYNRFFAFELERTHKNQRREFARMRAYAELMTRQSSIARDVFALTGYCNVAARGTAVFIGADRAHADRLWKTAHAAIQSLDLNREDGKPDFLFSHLDALILPGEKTNGKQRPLEEIVAPDTFVGAPIFRDLRNRERSLLERFN